MKNSPPVGLFSTDMDGTLLLPGRDFHSEDIEALELLGELNILRVIATGRSPFSFNRMIAGRELPADFLVLSSGAGIQDYNSGEFLRTSSMSRELTANAVSWLSGSGHDFCVQRSVPHNHVFAYSFRSGSNPDMERRIGLYSGHCRPLQEDDCDGPSTQIVIIVPPDRREDVLADVTESLGEQYNILRTTSPLDGESLWIEIFPAGVSKRAGVEWIASGHNLTREDVAAVGNDYNDHDLLEWAGHAYVVEDSPVNLRKLFRVVPSANEGGVAEAVKLWLIERGL
jgi:hydroxymethylpyrimidine pyrophosphatase-like HAD family hydrolase